ncbi:hypothetical protein BDW42DRAFT_202385 [Aspergillus taichungensis]|uniref:Uncharacterized protein n=1 Tax=Aspergillus taichungensis TaxID=482145 RepID=A0A2J5I6P2_9EURO|nr:hypothetical protein BDW42DRAFT_202385 [Aspergillus taichungensis]
MPASRSSITSSSHNDRLEPRLLRAVENNDTTTLQHLVTHSRETGQLTDSVLRVGLMRSCERGCIAATQYLLSQGAPTDVPPPRPSPLLRAAERNHVRIVQLLLDYGASPESPDKKGRTALMTAAWRNHWHMVHLLLARGADANARDLRRRNVLHNLAADKQCDWGEDVVALLLAETGCMEGADALGRTPLHWACATGKWRLAQMLLEAGADANAGESRNKAPLHLAIGHGRDDVVELLVRFGADVNARSDGGWTPLHNACDAGLEAMAVLLLGAGAQVNSQLLNGVTPLHLAAQGGHVGVVELLLAQPGVKRRLRDNFGSTPFLRAAQAKRRDVLALLAPVNNVDMLSADARRACEAFDATVVDFGNFHNENRVRRVSVYELLYGRDAENPRKAAFSTVPERSGATDFRWIHLPANDMGWVEALLTKAFIEEGAHDVESFKGLERSFHFQHRGQRAHSLFMRPLCVSSPRAVPGSRFHDGGGCSGGEGSVVEGSVGENRRCSGEGQGQKGKKSPLSGGGKKGEGQNESHCQDGGKKAKGQKKKPGTWPPSMTAARKDKAKPAPLSLCKETALAATSNVCVFMPYLHFETAQGRQKMQDAIQQAQMLGPGGGGGGEQTRTRDELLIRAHLASSSTSLHIRRTLDQFFYPNIDTQTRDQDQVVYRYQTKGQGRERLSGEPKIFMVDQLWMWIVGTNLIVTGFAQRWDQPRNDPLNVLDGIIEDINSKTREPVRSVYDLAITITNRCSGVFDRHRMGDEEYQFLDMFESCIGIATDRETLLFNLFNRASAQASDWLKNHRKLSRFARQTPPPPPPRPTTSNSYHEQPTPLDLYADELEREQPLFVDNLLDIGQETDLLSEAKDIRDELNMIRTVLQHQQHVLSDLQDAICETYHGQQRSQHEVKKRFKEQQRTIDMHLKDIERMDKQAERIYESITDLLDLKQKHANAFEARFARDQAAGTTRQGKIIMVFTIVTIVFLPLSFIASLFSINIVEFPRAQNGEEMLHLGFVARYIFGVGFAISIPLVLLALAVDDIGDVCQEGGRRLKIWASKRRGKEDVDTDDGAFGRRTIELERMVRSGAGRSVEGSYGGDLLPFSKGYSYDIK